MKFHIKKAFMLFTRLILFTVLLTITIFTPIFYYEQYKVQEITFTGTSKGDCRVVNLELAYKNKYKIYVFNTNKKDEGHLLCVDDKGIVHDKSKNSIYDMKPYSEVYASEIKDRKLVISGYFDDSGSFVFTKKDNIIYQLYIYIGLLFKDIREFIN